jgi:hypothetical protein
MQEYILRNTQNGITDANGIQQMTLNKRNRKRYSLMETSLESKNRWVQQPYSRHFC